MNWENCTSTPATVCLKCPIGGVTCSVSTCKIENCEACVENDLNTCETWDGGYIGASCKKITCELCASTDAKVCIYFMQIWINRNSS